MKIINTDIKRCVSKDGEADPIYCDYNTLTKETFILQDGDGKASTPPVASGWYYTGSVKMSPTSGELLWLCQDFTIDHNKLTFNDIDTYTSGYLSQIKKKGTMVNVEIGYSTEHAKEVILRDYGYASPRVYIDGVDPHDIIISGGYATKEYVNDAVAGKQDLITDDAKLAWDLISGAPEIPIELSSYATKDDIAEAVSGLASEEYVDEAISGVTVETTVISIPASTTAYTLQDGAYTHIPAADVTYTLPPVTDDKLHTVLITVGFPTATHTIAFASGGSAITPLDTLTISVSDVVEYLCRYDFVKASWVIVCGKI